MRWAGGLVVTSKQWAGGLVLELGGLVVTSKQWAGGLVLELGGLGWVAAPRRHHRVW